ncbi:MAG: T9SS type A sorting domain-containing protein [Bacteroidota bacterium]
MKTFLQILLLQSISFLVAAQQPVTNHLLSLNKKNLSTLRTTIPDEVIQHHVYSPEMILYSRDTVAASWVYKYTAYMHYNNDSLLESSLTYDTVANVPLTHDTTIFDTLRRTLLNENQVWNNGWQNNFKLEHTYWDTNFFNRTTKYYNGSGTTWTLYHADSTYGLSDINGNLVENYYDLFDIPSGIFKKQSKTLTDFDAFNRMQKRKSYQYDTTSIQYVISWLDSNIVYDNFYIDQAIDQISYTYNSGIQTPYLRNGAIFNGIYELDNIQTLKQYNVQQQIWDDYSRQTSTGQICNNLDSSLSETWMIGTGWQADAGSRFIFNFIDSCDYDEFIIQNFIPWLGTYRNAYKWVYPYQSTSGIAKNVDHQAEVTIFPNPFHETATLHSRPLAFGRMNNNTQLKIYNMFGVLVREEKINNPDSYVLHRGSLPDGLYFYELTTISNELKGRGKFVID